MACKMCGGSAPSRPITTTIPNTKTVAVVICPECDTRSCGEDDAGVKCDAKVRDPFAKRCPRGHVL